MVAFSECVLHNHLKCPLAKKSWWRHIWLAIKSCYLRNHASQMKSWYGTLSGSHGRSFRFRHENLPEAPPSRQITMTSYPACNKTSLSNKPCIPDIKLLWNAIRKSWSLFQNSSRKNSVKRSLAEKSRWRHIRLAIKPRNFENHASQKKSYYGTLSRSHSRSFRIRHVK